jgi:hypothetical protein
MTNERYPDSDDLSHARKTRRPFRLPDHFAEAQPGRTSDDHPVDLIIESLPRMAALRRKIMRLRQIVQRQVQRPLDFIRYEDARTDFTSRTQRAYYNLGYERGRFAGLADSSAATGTSDPMMRAFQTQVCSAVAESELARSKVITALIDIARAVLLEKRTL